MGNGQVFSEGLKYIGRIDDNGYVYDSSDTRFAQIQESGYITKVGGHDRYGKIDEDGTIRDNMSNVIGRIQADGYVYIHSKRVCQVSSAFIEKITPFAYDYGKPSTYKGRKAKDNENSKKTPVTLSKGVILLIIGVILGIVMMIEGGGASWLIGGPVVTFLLYGVYKVVQLLGWG